MEKLKNSILVEFADASEERNALMASSVKENSLKQYVIDIDTSYVWCI